MLNNGFLEEEIVNIYHKKHPQYNNWDSGILRVKVEVKNTTDSKRKIKSMSNKFQLCLTDDLIDENKAVGEHSVTVPL